MKEWAEAQRRPPASLLVALWALMSGGFALLCCGLVLNYGPLFLASGIFFGFAQGFWLARRAMLSAIRQVHIPIGGSDAGTEGTGR